MKWFDKWLAKKVHKAWDEARSPGFAIGKADTLSISSIVGAKTANLVREDRSLDANPDLNFRMFRAENGYVMEVRQMDRRTDRHSINMHLITDEEDLGQRIAQIITIESLKVQ